MYRDLRYPTHGRDRRVDRLVPAGCSYPAPDSRVGLTRDGCGCGWDSPCMSVAIDLVHIGGFRVDWGNVTAWAGALLTPLSLYVAHRCLRHDRMSAESKQARE
jgi:hypothetical protein